MPLYVSAKEAREGMRLAESFVLMGRTMLPAGRVLTSADAASLQKRFPNYHLRIGDPLLDEAIEFQDDSHDREVARNVKNKIVQCMSSVGQRFGSRTSVTASFCDEARSVIESITQYLADNPVSAALLDQYVDGDDYLSKHMGNVFYLSMVVAAAIRPYVVGERTRQTVSASVAMDLMPLGLGAMFIDLGMYALQDLFTQDKKLTAKDREAIHLHPIVGVEMLPEGFPAAARMVVRTHHENVDGSGYPEGIKGRKLHVFSRIVRIADAYDAATSKHIYKDAKSPVYALWAMSAGPYKRCYDPVVMKVFSSLIQPFPIGAKLRLSDGRQAVVVKYNHTNPFQPVVVVAFDENDQRLTNAQLEGPLTLDQTSGLSIKSFHGESLSFLYQDPRTFWRPAAPLHQTKQGEDLSLFELVFP